MLTADRVGGCSGLGGWGSGGIEHKRVKREKKLIDMDNSVVIAGGVEEGIGGINGEEGDMTWVVSTQIQCTSHVWWDCAAETCIILLTSVTPINSVKREKKINLILGKEIICS